MEREINPITYSKASRIAEVSKTNIQTWVDEGLLEKYEYGERKFINKNELENLLIIRERHNRQNWKLVWLDQKEK